MASENVFSFDPFLIENLLIQLPVSKKASTHLKRVTTKDARDMPRQGTEQNTKQGTEQSLEQSKQKRGATCVSSSTREITQTRQTKHVLDQSNAFNSFFYPAT